MPLKSVRSKCLRLVVPLFLVFFLSVSIFPAEALKQTRNNVKSTSTARTPTVTFGTGSSGSSSIVSTNNYASVTTTAGLTFNETANIVIPSAAAVTPSLDGSNITQFASATSGSCGLTTTVANDVLYVAVSILGTNTVSGVTNTGTALTWTLRAAKTNGANVRVETWYAISSSVFTGSITVTFASGTTFAIIAMGVKNANTPNPFDATLTTPATATGQGTAQSVTISTMIDNVLLIGTLAVSVQSGTGPTPSQGGGFTSIQRNHINSLGDAAEYQSLTATVSSASITFSTSSSVNWTIIGDAIWGKLPTISVDTDFTSPTGSGNVGIGDLKVGYLVSPAYPRQTTMYPGIWQLNLWAKSATANDAMDVALLVTDSSYNIVSAVCNKVTTGPVPSSLSLVMATYSGSSVVVPSGGHLVVVLTNLSGGSKTFTVYWGSGQMTNFRTPQIFDYVLRVLNSASSSFSISFSTNSYSSISRFVNFTMYVYSPTTTCIIITNGTFTQSSSSVLSLSGSSTFYMAVNATASDFNSISNLVFLLRFAPTTKPFTNDVINLTVN